MNSPTTFLTLQRQGGTTPFLARLKMIWWRCGNQKFMGTQHQKRLKFDGKINKEEDAALPCLLYAIFMCSEEIGQSWRSTDVVREYATHTRD
jgi:hypothetical protein